jgi:hypothetical protein
VEVRDKVLQAAVASAPGGSTALVGGGGSGSLAPVSEVNRHYAMNQAVAAMDDGAVVPYTSAAALAPAAHEQLLRMGRARATYARNLPKLCTFYARGECNRGSECPYRHEMPRDKDDPLAKQNYKDRYYGAEDPVAAKLLGRMEERKAAGGGGGGGGGFGVSDPESMPEHNDPSACTLWVGGLDESAGQDDVRCVLLGDVGWAVGKGGAWDTAAG